MSDGYLNEPGHGGVETSVEAADSIASVSNRLRALVYRTLHAHAGGLTVDELCEVAGYARYSLQPRFTELRHAGSIHDTGQRRLNVSGRRAIVWAVSAVRDQAA